MLKELENESKKKNMDTPSRSRARSASSAVLKPKPRQYIPNETAAAAKRFSRAGQGNRCTSRYEIYNSTTRPFGKRYREMVRSDESAHRESADAAGESSTESSQSAYATCCSEVETLKITGFQCIDENAVKHEVTLQTTVGGTVTEARNYDVDARDDGVGETKEDESFKSPEIVKRVQMENRLMYNMPVSSNWNTYREEQLTYEPDNQRVRREVVVRSRSLFDLQDEPPPVETPARAHVPQQRLSKATSENHLSDKGEPNNNQKPIVVDATPSKRYSSALNLTLGRETAANIKYKSQSDLRGGAQPPKPPLERPKSMDFLAAAAAAGKEHPAKSHAETLKKHFYYHPLKPNKKLNDNELPDPDKVQSTRQLFQKELKIPLPPSLNNQNPKTGRPRPTQEVRVVPAAAAAAADSSKPKLQKCVSVDMGTSVHNRWTDSGSVSSGVGSEASFDTTESSSENNACRGERYSSDDDDDDDDYLADKTTIELVGRPVSAEILNKIRKFGTSVTYYGGKVISSSRGAVCSPMTMTIMDEIRHQKEENVKLRLVKSNSCGSRMELMEEINKRNDKQVEAIQEEEDEDDERRGASSPKGVADGSCSKLSNASSDELSWKALIVIRKKMSAVPVFDMEFEEFEVLDENNKNRE